MNKYFQALLGFSLAALLRGLRFGLRNLFRASRASYQAVCPFEKLEEKLFLEKFNAIPQVLLEDVLGERKPEIKLRVMKYEDGMMPARDTIGFLSILVAENPNQVLEIGTYMGHSTRAMAENLENAIIHTVDLPPDFSIASDSHKILPKDDFHLISRRIVGREFKGRACENRIVQHFGDTEKFDFTKAGHPTFFFIDGSHTYEYCKNDSEKCLQTCPIGGTFLWHDCDLMHPGVVQFISEWRSAGRYIVRLHGTSLAYWKSV